MEEILKLSAKRDGMSVAGKVHKLLEDALELEEDLAWGKLIEQRLSKKPIKLVSHKDAWKRFTSK